MARLGSSDLDVYPLNLGGNTFGWTSDKDTSFAVLDAYAVAGGNFVDTSDSYMASAPGLRGGESETVLGQWFHERGNRDAIVLATKVSRHPEFHGLAPDTIARAAEASLRRLQTDHIDLYYAHYDDETVSMADSLGAFDELVRAGKVRCVGISNYAPARVQEWLDTADANGFARPVALQPHYNLVTREPFESQYRPLAERFDLGVLPYFALAAGFLAGKYRSEADLEGASRGAMAGRYLSPESLAVVDELDKVAAAHDCALATVAVAWLLAQPTVVAPIASARVPEQLDALLAATGLVLTDVELGRLGEVSARVPVG
ncbi:MAG TPA: aldo/keto reductase [Aldersonia sp.]